MNNMERMKINQGKLSHERLVGLLDYNPDTGIFINKTTKGKCTKGKEAGTLERMGYRKIIIDRTPYKSHRLAWFYVHAVWPGEELDHINRIKDKVRKRKQGKESP